MRGLVARRNGRAVAVLGMGGIVGHPEAGVRYAVLHHSLSMGGPIVSHIVPSEGVKLYFLQSFIATHGGAEVFEGMSTKAVCDNFIKSVTFDDNISFCDFMKNGEEAAAVAEAMVYVVHSWNNSFLTLVDTLTAQFPNPDTVIWLDIFSRNQHCSDLVNSWWPSAFRNLLGKIGHVCVVVPHWEDLSLLSRTWVLWEIGATVEVKNSYEDEESVATAVRLSLALTQAQRMLCLEDLRRNRQRVVSNIHNAIDFERSASSVAADKAVLIAQVQQHGGPQALNQFVFERLHTWLMELLSAAVHASPHDAELLETMVALLEGAARHGEAEPLLLEALRIRTEASGATHPDTLATHNQLGALYRNQGRLDEAEAVLLDCLQRQRQAAGADHPDTAPTLRNLALLYKRRGDYAKAEATQTEALQCLRSGRGVEHPDTLRAMTTLAGLYRTDHQLASAETLLADCLRRTSSSLGVDHIETLEAMRRLAEVQGALDRYEEAVSLLDDCLLRMRATLGDHHPDTLTTMAKLAALYEASDLLEDAERLHSECFGLRVTALGERHPSTSSSKQRLHAVKERRRTRGGLP